MKRYIFPNYVGCLTTYVCAAEVVILAIIQRHLV
jgi:hypothetical protein